MSRRRSRRTQRGITLAEAVLSCYIALAATLIYASAMPLANNGRAKAERSNVALSLARKETESIISYSFSNVTGDQLYSAGLLDSAVPLDLSSTMQYGQSGYDGFEFTNTDLGIDDSCCKLLPSGRAFVHIENEDIHSKRVDVMVFWDENGTPKVVKLSREVVSL